MASITGGRKRLEAPAPAEGNSQQSYTSVWRTQRVSSNAGASPKIMAVVLAWWCSRALTIEPVGVIAGAR